MDKITFPNIRKQFVPDPGYVICDCDLSGADAQVVAWEANDAKLKHAFAAGLNVHNENGKAIWGAEYDPKRVMRGIMNMRDQVKRGVHGTNYGASARTLAITLGWKIKEAEWFQDQWLKAHPEIRTWHDRVYYDLCTTRTIRNAFGYRIIYFDRPEGLLPEALAWTPQSTVAVVCARGAVRLSSIPWVQVLLQVHDSVVFQVPIAKLGFGALAEIHAALNVTVPYPDPLTIPWEISVSKQSWGDCGKISWTTSTQELETTLQ